MASTASVSPAGVDRDELRSGIKSKYTDVAANPEVGFHFHTGADLALMVGYLQSEFEKLPQSTVDSFAGTGCPFEFGRLNPGEDVADLGCGAGFDSLQAAEHVGSSGTVTGVDMTSAMVEKANAGSRALGLGNTQFKVGYLEDLPIPTDSVDVVISNGVINLCPDKVAVMNEVNRILRPGGRFQIADIVVHQPVADDARADIELWSG